jgi:hypothetical protein
VIQRGSLFHSQCLVMRSNCTAVSIGLRVEAPTNDEIKDPETVFLFTNPYQDDVWNFTPYIAMAATPTARLFVQSFVGYRLNTGYLEDEAIIGAAFDVRDQNYFMADVAVGCWMYRDRGGCGLIGLVPTIELHYTGAFDLEEPENTFNNVIYGHTDVLNLTGGVTAYFSDLWSLASGISVPLRENVTTFDNATFGTDRHSNGTLLANLNWYFGR